MRTYVLTHLSDAVLLRDLNVLVAQERTATAAVVAHIAEVDARRLYLPEGYPSMYDYCVGKLRLSEQAAMKRIRAGRTAQRFPTIFDALAAGRLHLSAVVLLTPHLTPDNADDLLAAAAYQTRAEIEQLLARRFPKPDVPARLEAIAQPAWLTSTELLSPGTVKIAANPLAPGPVESVATQLAPGTVEAFAFTDPLAPAQVEVRVPRPRVTPLSAERFALQFTIGKETLDKLRYVQALLSHRVPSGDVAQVFDRALDVLMGQLEKQKFAATTKPRPRSRRSTNNKRLIPAHVKHAVWQRDQGQCTFVSEKGQRCASRKFLEFDHIDPVARGGEATVEGMRLLCRGHNQFEAERTFGARFMSEKREEARRSAAEARTRAAAAEAPTRAAAAEARKRAAAEAEARARVAEAQARSRAVANEHARDVMACLRELGFRAGEARRAAEFCETIPETTLEERVRAALKFMCPKTLFHGRVGASLDART